MKWIDGSQIKCVLKSQANVGESPLWNPQESRLYWIDIQEKEIHRLHPGSSTHETFKLPDIVTSIALRASGGLALTLKRNFAFFDPDTQDLTLGPEVESEGKDQRFKNNRFNDGKCDFQGRYFSGTMNSKDWDQPSGHLFCYEKDKAPRAVLSEVICSNGMGWSPDGKTMYHSESFRYAIFAYDFDTATGNLSNRRLFAEIDRKSGGFPDGMSIDSDGFVWSNIVGIGEIHRFDPQGRVERKIRFPVSRATDCTFGGPELKTLYVTSARETLTKDQLQKEPLAGSLFSIECEVSGLPSTPMR
jgi:sugar lactone lactonase YvrE